ncbi:MAG TPA: LLM class flavin-dependent oxidoreductase [Solirubrobacterales bacterium]|nr:LLM class flavin-dependent oxidoreductase [Solirubrobacterales bacterium]
MEVWLHTFARPGQTAATARRAEAQGYSGMLVADSQNLTAEVWVELAFAAAATERLKLGPGVTNPATRDISVTASAAATLQEESGGRVVLGFARGDSALRQIGREPAGTREFEIALERLVAYLAGEPVRLAGDAIAKIGWIEESGRSPVPVHVAASGARTIASGARHAQGVDFTVGAEVERLRWAVESARAVDRDDPPSLGAFVNVAVDPDRARARDLVRGSTSTLARFGAESRSTAGLSKVTQDGVARLTEDFEESQHGSSRAAAARELSDEFLDRFAVCGSAEEVAERLVGLRQIGLDRVVVVPGSLDADPGALDESDERFAVDVLPIVLSA